MHTPFSLEGKIALVTGSSTGLGKGIAHCLGQAGATVVMNYARNTTRAELAFSQFQKAGHKGLLVKADVTSESDVKGLVHVIEDQVGPIDILVFNATPDQPQKPVEDYSWDEYQAMLDFFVKSPTLLTQAVVTTMKARHTGRIINISSEVIAASMPNFSAYVAAKGAQNAWTRCLAAELAWKITANCVEPGWIPTERHAEVPKDELKAYLDTIPLGRWGTPADVGHAVLYLASDEAAFLTGQTLQVNGGRTHSI